jgi:hypothetical protein
MCIGNVEVPDRTGGKPDEAQTDVTKLEDHPGEQFRASASSSFNRFRATAISDVWRTSRV